MVKLMNCNINCASMETLFKATYPCPITSSNLIRIYYRTTPQTDTLSEHFHTTIKLVTLFRYNNTALHRCFTNTLRNACAIDCETYHTCIENVLTSLLFVISLKLCSPALGSDSSIGTHEAKRLQKTTPPLSLHCTLLVVLVVL